MCRISERPQQAHRKAFGAGGDQRGDGVARFLLVQRNQHGAVGDHALGDAAHHGLRHQRRRRFGVQEIHRLRLRQAAGAADRPARDDQRVLEAGRRDQPDAGAAALDQRIGRHRRSVGKSLGLGQQRPDIDASRLCERRQRIQDALFRRLRCRERLVEAQAPLVVDLDQVGEGAAGVDAEDAALGHQALAVGSVCDRVPQVASVPPSTRRSMPVMKEASSETRNSTALA